jgi:hypothetical protein
LARVASTLQSARERLDTSSMSGKRPGTLAARVASVQTRVTSITLVLVLLGTAVAVTAALSRKTDQQLHAVIGRVTPYLDEKLNSCMP